MFVYVFKSESLDISNTSLTGSLCNPSYEIFSGISRADCGGDTPEILCPCCIECCEDRTGYCDFQDPERSFEDWESDCPQLINDIESDGLSRCECSSTGWGQNVSCYHIDDCPTCNEDGTICGSMLYFSYQFDETGISSSYRGMFQYHQGDGGRASPVTIETYDDFCYHFVAVNGQECTNVSRVQCQGGHWGLEIDCRNVVLFNNETDETADDPLTYDPCILELSGGVLDVFGWRDWDMYSGCPFRFSMTDFDI